MTAKTTEKVAAKEVAAPVEPEKPVKAAPEKPAEKSEPWLAKVEMDGGNQRHVSEFSSKAGAEAYARKVLTEEFVVETLSATHFYPKERVSAVTVVKKPEGTP